MLADRVLRNSLVVSIIVHSIFIFSLSLPKVQSNINQSKELELTYLKKAVTLLPPALVGQKEKLAAPVFANGEKAPLQKTAKPLDKVRKPPILSTEKIRLTKALPTQRIDFPKLKMQHDKMLIFYNEKDLSGNPSYLKYHNIVRSKIEKTANASKPYIFNFGEVHLIFTILNSGDLKNVNLIDKESIGDSALRQCALDSVYAASPFPLFTSDMKEDHLTLQVTISFER